MVLFCSELHPKFQRLEEDNNNIKNMFNFSISYILQLYFRKDRTHSGTDENSAVVFQVTSEIH